MARNVEIIGLRELQSAIKRNPNKVFSEGQDFLSRGLSKYKGVIINNPWRIGGNSGGAPVANDPRYPRKYQKSRSGNLRDTHQTNISGLIGRIYPTADYAMYVHSGTKFMEARPWLDYAKSSSDSAIKTLYQQFLKNVVSDLAK